MEIFSLVVSFLLSDLDPLQAPQWSVRVRKADNPQCLLGKNISRLVLNTIIIQFFFKDRHFCFIE